MGSAADLACPHSCLGAGFGRPASYTLRPRRGLSNQPLPAYQCKLPPGESLGAGVGRSSGICQDRTMVQRPIRILGDPVLRSLCREVDSFDLGLVSLVADLEETVASPGRAGLAANQIGVVRRVFSWHIDGEVGHLVNPVIEAEEGEQDDDGEEGCLSIPGLFYPCPRAELVRGRGSTSTATRWWSKVMACWRAVSSTRWTTSTVASSSTDCRGQIASRRSAPCGSFQLGARVHQRHRNLFGADCRRPGYWGRQIRSS